MSKDPVTSLQDYRGALTKDNLPLSISFPNQASNFDIMEPSAFHILYRLYHISAIDNCTDLLYIILANQKYSARISDSMLYIA